jgi:hypothetical protein
MLQYESRRPDAIIVISGPNYYIISPPLAEKGKMLQDLSDTSLLQHLEGVAAQLGLEVRYENLADDEFSIHSGGCRLLGRNLILIHFHLPPLERARILARELSKWELEDLYLLPRVRQFILLQARSREKNLPPG